MSKIKNIWILSHASQQPPYNTMLRFHNWGKELVKRGYNVVIVAASRLTRGRKMSMGSIEEKIAKQKLQLEKSKEKYEADKGKLAELIKLRNELQTTLHYLNMLINVQHVDVAEIRFKN